MIAIGAALLGAILGWRTAGKRGGNRLDKLQYGAVYAIAGGLLGSVVTVVIHRMIV